MKFEEMLAKAHEDKSAGRGAPTLSRDELIRDPWRRVTLTYNDPINVNANDGERISSEGTQSKPPEMGGPKGFRKKCSKEDEEPEEKKAEREEDENKLKKSLPSFQDMYDGKVDMMAEFRKAGPNCQVGMTGAPNQKTESNAPDQEASAPETPEAAGEPGDTQANDLGHDQHT